MMGSGADDYDSPWKEAVEHALPDFLRFYFPEAHGGIDWSQEVVFLDKELQAVVQDAELGRRYVDKLVRVTALDGEEKWIFLHIEIQGTQETGFAERIFVYNYRLFDRYRRPVASLVVLADDTPGWKPSSFGFALFGCRLHLDFSSVKLLDHAGSEEALLAQDNPFALVTAAHLLTRATRNDMAARLAAKLRLVRRLYQRGWEKQRIIDLFTVIDWLMRLPAELEDQVWQTVGALEEGGKMQYVTSVERIGIKKGRAEGLAEGEARGEARGEAKGKAEALIRLSEKRFGPLPADLRTRVLTADVASIEVWLDRLMDAPSLEVLFGAPN